MTNNHPSRNWRRIAREAAGLYATRWRMAQADDREAPLQFLSYEEGNALEDAIRAAHLAGYEAGRKSVQQRTEPPT